MSEQSGEDIVAYDDRGRPITRDDLLLESYRLPLDDFPLGLLPPFDWEGTDEEWDEKELIEAVKERRRGAAGDGSGSPKRRKRRPF